MRAPDYLTILFAFGLVVGGCCEKLISTTSRAPNIDLDHGDSWGSRRFGNSLVKIDKSNNHLQVVVNAYIHKTTRECMKRGDFSLVMEGKKGETLGSFITSCDTITASVVTNDCYKIGDVARLLVVNGDVMTGGVWGVFVTGTSVCLQRRYTDSQWRRLAEPEEVTLSQQQCQKVMKENRPVGSIPKQTQLSRVGVSSMEKVISTSSRPSDINLGRDYFQGGTGVKSAVYIEGSRNHLKVLVTSYYHNLIRRKCVKQVKFRLVMDGKELEPLGSFLISCETNTPSTTTRNSLEIGNVAQLIVLGGDPLTGGVWAVFMVDTGGCLQKRYTDNQWRKLEEPEDMTLTEEQCQKVMKDGMPMTQMVKTLPEVGAAMLGKVIWLGETPSADYSQYTEEWSKEVGGAVVKVTVKKQTNSATKDCALLVLLEAETWDDDLGSARLSCVDPPLFTRDKGMISLNGLMYLRDQPGEATWAVFVKDDHCVLRVFTDKDQEIVQVDDRKLDWEQCQQAVATQSIDTQSGPVPSTEIERTAQVKILSVKEECDYQEEYVEVGTDTTTLFMAKVVVHRLLNTECLTQVNIYSVEYVSKGEGRRRLVEKDFLDCIQISCSPQRHVNTMIELNRINVGNRVYVLTKPDQPIIYAVLVREGSCVLRKYTDEKMQLVGKEDRPLTWEECMEVIDKQRVDWLPEVPAPTVPSTPVTTPRMAEAAIQRAKTNVAKILELIYSQVPFYTQAIKEFAATRFQPIPRPVEPDNTKLTPQPITAPPVTGKRRWFSWLGL